MRPLIYIGLLILTGYIIGRLCACYEERLYEKTEEIKELKKKNREIDSCYQYNLKKLELYKLTKR